MLTHVRAHSIAWSTFAALVAANCSYVGDREPDAIQLNPIWFSPGHYHGFGTISNGILYVDTHQGIAALDEATGRLLWTAKLWTTNAAAFAENVAVDSSYACILDQWTNGCIDVHTGKVLWTHPTVPVTTPPGQSQMIRGRWYFGASDHSIHAVDPATGRRFWTTDIAPGSQFLTRVFGVTVLRDTVYAATVRWVNSNGFLSAGDVVALDRRTGKILWHYVTPGEHGGIQGAPLVTDTRVIVNDVYAHPHGLIGLDRATGRELWRTRGDSTGFIDAETTPTLVGDTVFVGSADTQIYAVRAADGVLIWRTRGNGGSLEGHVGVCPRALVVMEFAAGWPIIVDRESLEWQPTNLLEKPKMFGSAVTVSGDTVFLSGDGGYYAYRCK